jgi:hypothetical protein
MTCGMTRAFHAISVGHLQEAVAYHGLSPLFYALTVFHLLIAVLRLLGWRRRFPWARLSVRSMVYGSLALLAVHWVVRLYVLSVGQ